jgi:hypothetical protein
MIAEPKELPIYIITSSNWTMEVTVDEYNAQFDVHTQILESATRAIEFFKGRRGDVKLIMNPDSRNEEAFLGTTVLVHLKNTNPDDSAVVFTHVCLANMGLYTESSHVNELLEKQITEITEKQVEEERKKNELKKSLKNFSLLKKEIELKQKENKSPKRKKKKTDTDLPDLN